MTTIDEPLDIARLERAYDVGRARTPARPSDPFTDYLNSLVCSRVGRSEGLCVVHIWHLSDLALKSARRGGLNVARHHIGEARIASQALASPMVEALSATLLTAADAYVRYREADWHAAYALIDQTLALSGLMRDQYGMTGFEMHRIQQVVNVARIEARKGDHLGGARTIGCGLAYLSGDERAWPLDGHEPSRTAVLSVPQSWREQMCLQLVNEAALVRAQAEPGRRREVLLALEQRPGLLDELGTAGQGAAEWLRAMAAVDGRSTNCIVTTSERALQNTTMACHPCWYALALELARLVDPMGADGSRFARRVQHDLTRDDSGATKRLLAAAGLRRSHSSLL